MIPNILDKLRPTKSNERPLKKDPFQKERRQAFQVPIFLRGTFVRFRGTNLKKQNQKKNWKLCLEDEPFQLEGPLSGAFTSFTVKLRGGKLETNPLKSLQSWLVGFLRGGWLIFPNLPWESSGFPIYPPPLGHPGTLKNPMITTTRPSPGPWMRQGLEPLETSVQKLLLETWRRDGDPNP